jgi:peptidoglycan-N-acetylglucosamine deacetylase
VVALQKIKTAFVWDDGLVSDLKIIELLHKYDILGTFAIAPNTHGDKRKLNDTRSRNYGLKVSIAEMKNFKPFEILNHTANHLDLAKSDEQTTKEEILIGKKMLENLFEREIIGFCYPYGTTNAFSESILKNSGHKFARISRSWPVSKPNFSTDNLYEICPTTRWNYPDFGELIEQASGGYLIIWGHSYEIREHKHWEQIERLIKLLSQHPRIEVMPLSKVVV